MVPASLPRPLGPDDHVKGPEDAPLELVMYGDFECPYCVASQSILARVLARLEGELRFAFRHLPLESVHPHARHAAEAAVAAGEQGAFWEMHDALYSARGKLEDGDLVAHARGLGLDAERVGRELAGGAHAARVELDAQDAAALGLRSTPVFFVNGVQHTGSYDAGSLVAALRGKG
jgi:Na+:H+ antiporter, NhaA family